MTYRLKVVGYSINMYHNFLDWEKVNFPNSEPISYALSTCHAINIPNTLYLEFETEEDAMYFKLRFT